MPIVVALDVSEQRLPGFGLRRPSALMDEFDLEGVKEIRSCPSTWWKLGCNGSGSVSGGCIGNAYGFGFGAGGHEFGHRLGLHVAVLRLPFVVGLEEDRAEELWPNLNDDDLRKAAYRSGESVFVTVRHRTVRTKGALSHKTATLMVFKLILAASKTWRRLKGESCLLMLIAGVTVADGIANLPASQQRAA